jgi:hypothetical protein
MSSSATEPVTKFAKLPDTNENCLENIGKLYWTVRYKVLKNI